MNSFKNVLDSDEFIISEYKPEKFKFYFIRIISVIFALLFLSFPIMVGIFMGDPFDMFGAFVIIVLLSILIVTIITVFTTKLAYDKRLYAYTNKRVLIRTGVVGVDFKSLDLKMIGASEVRVDLIDKLINKNTGTIKFGSHAIPTNTQGIQAFQFSGIKDPYNVYREIKKYIDEVKEKQ